MVFMDGFDQAMNITSAGYPSMGVTEVEMEKVLRGSKEGFSDSVKTNSALIRKRLRDTRLKVVEYYIGERSHTLVQKVYMEDLVREEFLEQVKERLEAFRIDGILDSGMLEQLTEDRSGEARLYLESVSQGGATPQLLIGYQIDGVPNRFSAGGHAAELTLSGTSVTRLTLRFRQYSTAGETSLLLPRRQTLAIAAEHPGTELAVGYADGGGDSVSASWLAD